MCTFLSGICSAAFVEKKLHFHFYEKTCMHDCRYKPGATLGPATQATSLPKLTSQSCWRTCDLAREASPEAQSEVKSFRSEAA